MRPFAHGIAVTAVCAQVCFLAALYTSTRNDPFRHLNRVLRQNPAVGRLSALDGTEGSHTRGAASGLVDRQALLEIASALEPAARDGDLRAIRALAAARAGLGRLEEAIQSLEPIAPLAGDGLVWSDLSALYLSRGDALSDLQALDAVSRANGLAGGDPAVRFNYRLALETLGLARDGTVRPLNTAQKDGLTARREVESHLTTWARNGNSDALRNGCRLADAHHERTRDRFLLDLCKDAQAHAALVARGWAALSDAQRQSDAIQFGEARRSVQAALEAFAGVSEAGTAAAGYQLAVIHYQTGAFDQTAAWLAASLSNLERRHWWQLHSRSEWLAGIQDETRGHAASALTRFQSAANRLARLDEPENELTVRSLSAYMLQALGDYTGSWRAHHTVLQSADRIQHLHRRQAVFLTAGLAASALGYQHAAAHLLDEYVWAAQKLGAAPVLAEAYLNRLSTVGTQWPKPKQLAEVRLIEDVSRGIDDPDRRAFVLARAALHEARLVPDAAALSLLSSTVTHIRESGRLFLMPEAMLRQAESQRRIGDRESAERTLLEGIDHFHAQWKSAAGTPHRVSFLDSGFMLYETLLDLLTDQDRDDEALRLFDRARTLGNAVSPSARPTPTLRDLQAGLRAGTTALLFMKTREKLRIWRVTPDRIHRAISPLPVSEIDTLVARWRALTSQAQSLTEMEGVSRALHEALIAPVGPLAESRIIVVPDGSVHAIPFAALEDERGVPLVRRAAVVSTRTVGEILQEWQPVRPESVLAVGSPPYDESTYGFLPRLPFAAREAMDVAALYPDPRVLNGASGTSAALADGVPSADVVHLATHAVIHRDDPALSYLLIAAGGSHDGRLTTAQMAGMPWHHTSLVVLAACSTSSGPASRSQGPLGFSRILLEAGVPRVVATLWDIDDRIAHELLTTFHRNVRGGLDPIEALRGAQLTLATRYPSTQWGAFAIYGTRLSQPTNGEHTR